MDAVRARAFCVVACAALAGVRSSVSAGVAIGPAAIVGSVRDPSGRPVAGALVVAIGPTSREALSSAAGLVTLQALPLGSYSIRVTRAGFAPFGTVVTLADARGGLTLVRVRIAPATFANLHSAGSAIDVVTLATNSEASVAHALERAPDANLVPVRDALGAAPGLLGTSPHETRVELDGIPLAGGSASLAALRFRSALGLSNIDLVRGPVIASSSLRNAIGGVIDYRTADVDAAASFDAAFGYNTTFGRFQHLRANQAAGKLGILTDIVAGGGESRSQTLKLRYALSPAASLAVAHYGSQSTATLGTQIVTANAPAFAADLRARAGTGTLEARVFASASEVVSPGRGPMPNDARESARTHGTQLRYTLPAGDSLLALGFDRRTDDARDLSRTYATVTGRADIALSSSSRIELGDAYSGGTSLPRRHDPQIAFAFRPAERTTVKLSAGSAYATAPDALLQRDGAFVAAARAPETSFGYRVGIDEALADGDRAWLSLDTQRRFDRFAAYAAARSTGLEIGYERAIAPGRFGGSAYVRMQRSAAYGPAQARARNFDFVARNRSRDPFVGDPYTKARASFGYALGGESLDIGATYLGANNALAPHGVVLGDARVHVTLGHLLDVGFGVENMFGVMPMDPALAPYYVRREMTLTLGRFSGP